jgi:hypothetical protein
MSASSSSSSEEVKGVLGKRHARPEPDVLAEMESQTRHWADLHQRSEKSLASVTSLRNFHALKHQQHRNAAAFWRSFANLPGVVYGHPDWSHCVEVDKYRLLRFHVSGLEATRNYNAEQRTLASAISKLVIPTHMDKDDLYDHIDGVHIGNNFYYETPLPAHIAKIWNTLLDTVELKKQYDSVTLSNTSSFHVLDTLDVEVDTVSKNMRLLHDAHAILHVWIRDDLIDPILNAHTVPYVAAARQNAWLVRVARLVRPETATGRISPPRPPQPSSS